MSITINDYKHILEFYNKPIPKTQILIKKQYHTLYRNYTFNLTRSISSIICVRTIYYR